MPVVVAVATAALVTLAVWQGRQSRDSPAAHWSVGLSIAAGAVATLVLGRGRQRATTRAWLAGVGPAWRRAAPAYRAGAVVWVVLAAAVVGWDLWSFAVQAAAWPTLSREVGRVSGASGGRAALFGAWALLGVAVAAGGRTRRRRP